MATGPDSGKKEFSPLATSMTLAPSNSNSKPEEEEEMEAEEDFGWAWKQKKDSKPPKPTSADEPFLDASDPQMLTGHILSRLDFLEQQLLSKDELAGLHGRLAAHEFTIQQLEKRTANDKSEVEWKQGLKDMNDRTTSLWDAQVRLGLEFREVKNWGMRCNLFEDIQLPELEKKMKKAHQKMKEARQFCKDVETVVEGLASKKEFTEIKEKQETLSGQYLQLAGQMGSMERRLTMAGQSQDIEAKKREEGFENTQKDIEKLQNALFTLEKNLSEEQKKTSTRIDGLSNAFQNFSQLENSLSGQQKKTEARIDGLYTAVSSLRGGQTRQDKLYTEYAGALEDIQAIGKRYEKIEHELAVVESDVRLFPNYHQDIRNLYKLQKENSQGCNDIQAEQKKTDSKMKDLDEFHQANKMWQESMEKIVTDMHSAEIPQLKKAAIASEVQIRSLQVFRGLLGDLCQTLSKKEKE